jgi:sodium/potassium-transporting ATPase subunit beta
LFSFAAQLFAFYGIFYIALAALFSICMKGLLMTINEQSPKWLLGESLIGTNPGLGFRPLPDDVQQGSLIWYDASNQTQITYWTKILDRFMKGFYNLNRLKVSNFYQNVISIRIQLWFYQPEEL